MKCLPIRALPPPAICLPADVWVGPLAIGSRPPDGRAGVIRVIGVLCPQTASIYAAGTGLCGRERGRTARFLTAKQGFRPAGAGDRGQSCRRTTSAELRAPSLRSRITPGLVQW
jgi:hypothetical protein